jgi:hypothetical protein
MDEILGPVVSRLHLTLSLALTKIKKPQKAIDYQSRLSCWHLSQSHMHGVPQQN